MIEKNYRIQSALEGYTVLLRNKYSAEDSQNQSRGSVLFVHGATYGSTSTFDYPVAGQSWMDHLAANHYDVWCLDLLGYGLSDRPAVMDQPARDHAPIVDTAHATVEVEHAVTFILEQRQIPRLSLIGYSWGTAICGNYSAQYPNNVSKLVLSGALWLEGLPLTESLKDNLGAYRTVDVESMMQRWAAGLTQNELDQIVSAQDRLKWCQQTLACDPKSAETGLLRAPTGVIEDYMRVRNSGEDWYDPGQITASVLIVVGELDEETTPAQGQQLFTRLTAAATKELCVIGQGTHSMLLERSRHQLHRVVDGFLAD